MKLMTKMGIEIEKKITMGTLLNVGVILVMVVLAFAYLDSEITKVTEQQQRHEQFRMEVRQNYIDRERLDYMVIQRLDRMERNIEGKLDRISKSLNVPDDGN